MSYHGLGKEYQIRTNVPLLQTFTADIPVEQMATDAMAVAEERAKALLPYLLGGIALVVGATVALVGAFVVGRKTA